MPVVPLYPGAARAVKNFSASLVTGMFATPIRVRLGDVISNAADRGVLNSLFFAKMTGIILNKEEWA